VKEKEYLEVEMSEKMDTMKKDFNRQMEESKQKAFQFEEQSKEIHRSRIAAESEFDKQKALME
jgi:hypothetical protein